MKVKVKYNKCKTCENAGWSMPQCAECNRTNGYKYYRSGRPLAPNGLDYLNPEDMEALEKGNEKPQFLTKRFNLPTCGSNAQTAVNPEHLWQLNLDNLKAGLFGDPKEPEAILRYWQAQELANYPSASENVKYFTELAEKSQSKREALQAVHILRHIKWYLVRIIDEWYRREGEPHFYENNIMVYNHVRKELDDLETYAEKLGVNLDEEATDESKNT